MAENHLEKICDRRIFRPRGVARRGHTARNTQLTIVSRAGRCVDDGGRRHYNPGPMTATRTLVLLGIIGASSAWGAAPQTWDFRDGKWVQVAAAAPATTQPVNGSASAAQT